MNKSIASMVVCCCLALVLAPFVVNGTPLEDERASAFVAGEADQNETFEPSEGGTLLALACLAVLVSFGLLMAGARTHRRLDNKLDALEERLVPKDSSHA